MCREGGACHGRGSRLLRCPRGWVCPQHSERLWGGTRLVVTRGLLTRMSVLPAPLNGRLSGPRTGRREGEAAQRRGAGWCGARGAGQPQGGSRWASRGEDRSVPVRPGHSWGGPGPVEPCPSSGVSGDLALGASCQHGRPGEARASSISWWITPKMTAVASVSWWQGRARARVGDVHAVVVLKFHADDSSRAGGARGAAGSAGVSRSWGCAWGGRRGRRGPGGAGPPLAPSLWAAHAGLPRKGQSRRGALGDISFQGLDRPSTCPPGLDAARSGSSTRGSARRPLPGRHRLRAFASGSRRAERPMAPCLECPSWEQAVRSFLKNLTSG